MLGGSSDSFAKSRIWLEKKRYIKVLALCVCMRWLYIKRTFYFTYYFYDVLEKLIFFSSDRAKQILLLHRFIVSNFSRDHSQINAIKSLLPLLYILVILKIVFPYKTEAMNRWKCVFSTLINPIQETLIHSAEPYDNRKNNNHVR